MELCYFILAGGYGTRALPLSASRAKAAFPLLGVPLLTRMAGQLEAMTGSGARGLVNLHHLPQTVVNCLKPEWQIELIYEKELSGSRILTAALAEGGWTHLLVLNGDVFCDIPLEALTSAAMHHDGALLVREFFAEGPYRVLKGQNNLFLKRGELSSAGMMFTGVGLFSRKLVTSMRETNFFDVLEKEGLDVALVPYKGIWFDFGDPRTYFSSNLRLMDNLNCPESMLWSSEARVLSDPDSVKRTIIWPNAVIQEGVHLSNCIVCDHVVPETGMYREGIWTQDGFFPF